MERISPNRRQIGRQEKLVRMHVSIIICTYNRCESLRRTLQTVCALQIAPDVQWEVVVVDNNSSDETRKVCDDVSAKLPLRYVFEARQGKSYALNTAAQVTHGNLLLFTDDDVDVQPGWVGAMLGAFERHPEKCFFGGRVVPLWECAPPAWVRKHFAKLPQFPQLELGNEERFARVDKGELFPGANCAYPRSVFSAKHCFSVKLRFLEDMEFIQRIAKAGWQGVYVPDAIVAHRHEAARCTEKYLRSWYVKAGVVLVQLEEESGMPVMMFGVPRYLWRTFMFAAGKYFLTRWTCCADYWLPAERDMALTWGKIVEYRRKGRRA